MLNRMITKYDSDHTSDRLSLSRELRRRLGAAGLTVALAISIGGCEAGAPTQSDATAQIDQPTTPTAISETSNKTPSTYKVDTSDHEEGLANKRQEYTAGNTEPATAKEWMERLDYLSSNRPPEGTPLEFIVLDANGNRFIDGPIVEKETLDFNPKSGKWEIHPTKGTIESFAPNARGGLAKPNTKGYSNFFAAHVRYGKGVNDRFTNLDETKLGNTILIKTDEDVAVFNVVSINDYDKNVINADHPVYFNQSKDTSSPSQLVAMTCVNVADEDNANFARRHVVRADFVGTLDKKFSNEIFKGIMTLGTSSAT